LLDLTEVSSLDEDVSDGFVALAQRFYVVAKEFANFINVEVVRCYQGVGGTFVEPLGGIAELSLFFRSKVLRVLTSQNI
jgi:hypothetical protein